MADPARSSSARLDGGWRLEYRDIIVLECHAVTNGLLFHAAGLVGPSHVLTTISVT